MSKIETEVENFKGIMIDGYVPSIETLRDLYWKELRKYLPKTEWYWWGIPRYLQKNLSEKQVLRIFGTLVYGFRYKFCQFKDQVERTRASVYFPRTSGSNYFSLERNIKVDYKKELIDYLPILIKEYKNDEELGLKNYIQNVIIYCMHPSISCNKLDECNKNWLKRSGFEIKKKEDYKDYVVFRDVWKEIIKYFIKDIYKTTDRFVINGKL